MQAEKENLLDTMATLIKHFLEGMDIKHANPDANMDFTPLFDEMQVSLNKYNSLKNGCYAMVNPSEST